MVTKMINNIDTTKLKVVIEFYCVVPRNEYNLGSLRLKQGKKDLILDVTQSHTNNDNHQTTITCDLEFNDSIDNSFKNNMLFSDLYQKMDIATLFVGGDYEVEFDSITMFIITDGNTTAVNIDQE